MDDLISEINDKYPFTQQAKLRIFSFLNINNQADVDVLNFLQNKCFVTAVAAYNMEDALKANVNLIINKKIQISKVFPGFQTAWQYAEDLVPPDEIHKIVDSVMKRRQLDSRTELQALQRHKSSQEIDYMVQYIIDVAQADPDEQENINNLVKRFKQNIYAKK